MAENKYRVRYLERFEKDLSEAVDYIGNVLGNAGAARRLIDDTENAIIERLKCPLSFPEYASEKKRKHAYYRINVRNYSVYYVVIDDVMEVRRFIYAGRDIDRII